MPPQASELVRKFFKLSLPKLLQAQRETCARLGGRIGLVVEGNSEWTVDLKVAQVEPVLGDTLDSVFFFSEQCFSDLLAGRANLQAALTSGGFRFAGDAQRSLEALGLVLSEGGR